MSHPPTPTGPPDGLHPVDELRHWSLPMAMAWILWRRTREVREAWKDYCHNFLDWTAVMGPTALVRDSSNEWRTSYGQTGWALSSRRPPTLFDVLNKAARNDPASADKPVLYFTDAQCELWENLKSGRLKAKGIQTNTGAWTWIAPEEWNEIGYFDPPSGHPDAIGARNENEPLYYDVALRREEVVAIWGHIANALPALHIRRGRKPKTDWGTVEELLHRECDKNGGIPGPEMDHEWTTLADAELFIKGVLTNLRVSIADSGVRTYATEFLKSYAKRKGR